MKIQWKRFYSPLFFVIYPLPNISYILDSADVLPKSAPKDYVLSISNTSASNQPSQIIAVPLEKDIFIEYAKNSSRYFIENDNNNGTKVNPQLQNAHEYKDFIQLGCHQPSMPGISCNGKLATVFTFPNQTTIQTVAGHNNGNYTTYNITGISNNLYGTSSNQASYANKDYSDIITLISQRSNWAASGNTPASNSSDVFIITDPIRYPRASIIDRNAANETIIKNGTNYFIHKFPEAMPGNSIIIIDRDLVNTIYGPQYSATVCVTGTSTAIVNQYLKDGEQFVLGIADDAKTIANKYIPMVGTALNNSKLFINTLKQSVEENSILAPYLSPIVDTVADNLDTLISEAQDVSSNVQQDINDAVSTTSWFEEIGDDIIGVVDDVVNFLFPNQSTDSSSTTDNECPGGQLQTVNFNVFQQTNRQAIGLVGPQVFSRICIIKPGFIRTVYNETYNTTTFNNACDNCENGNILDIIDPFNSTYNKDIVFNELLCGQGQFCPGQYYYDKSNQTIFNNTNYWNQSTGCFVTSGDFDNSGCSAFQIYDTAIYLPERCSDLKPFCNSNDPQNTMCKYNYSCSSKNDGRGCTGCSNFSVFTGVESTRQGIMAPGICPAVTPICLGDLLNESGVKVQNVTEAKYCVNTQEDTRGCNNNPKFANSRVLTSACPTGTYCPSNELLAKYNAQSATSTTSNICKAICEVDPYITGLQNIISCDKCSSTLGFPSPTICGGKCSGHYVVGNSSFYLNSSEIDSLNSTSMQLLKNYKQGQFAGLAYESLNPYSSSIINNVTGCTASFCEENPSICNGCTSSVSDESSYATICGWGNTCEGNLTFSSDSNVICRQSSLYTSSANCFPSSNNNTNVSLQNCPLSAPYFGDYSNGIEAFEDVKFNQWKKDSTYAVSGTTLLLSAIFFCSWMGNIIYTKKASYKSNKNPLN